MDVNKNSSQDGPHVNPEQNLVCPACGVSALATDLFFTSVEQDYSFAGFRYQKCKKCLTIFNSSAVTESEQTNYHVNYWGKGDAFTFVFAPAKSPEERLQEWVSVYESVFSPFFQRRSQLGLSKKPTLLDIGAGHGAFCGAANAMGFDSYGLEPNENSRRKAQANFPQCKFLNGSIYDLLSGPLKAAMPKGGFDVITMHDVLEHMAEPARLMNDLRNLLSSEGSIYVRVPSGEHLQFDYLKQFAWSILAPFHRTMFTRTGIELMLKPLGLRVLRHLPAGYVWGWTRGMSWKLGMEKEYRELREVEAFRRLDYAIDTMLEDISRSMNREPSIFCEIGK